jgi:hypothetical protein
MAEPHTEQPALPGLELEPELGTATALRSAVITTLTALHDDQLLEPRHAGLAQLALELADAVTAGRRSGRASAAAMAAAQLRETLQALPAPMAADAAQKFQSFVESLVAGDG